jgi:hypothetical protein
MKIKLMVMTTMLFLAMAAKAQLSVNVYINGVMSGQYTIRDGQTDGGMWYKKNVYRTASKFAIEVKGKELRNDQYKRSVEAVDDASNSLALVKETETTLGHFDLAERAILKRLGKGKIVKLYLQLDPASDKSKAPSKRIFIGNLTAK